jgi:hypothetical protein
VIGILMLDTGFERFPGDVGHPNTWPFPVRFRTVAGASAAQATTLSDDALLAPFLAAGRELVREGATGIATSCGFLVLYQRALAAALPVPVATSALLQIPSLATTMAGRIGVLTFDPVSLGPAHLACAGAPADTPVAGLRPDSAFRADVLGGPASSFATREAEVVAARRLREATPDVGAVVLECTNFAPHAAAIRAALGLPVYDIVTGLTWFEAGLR